MMEVYTQAGKQWWNNSMFSKNAKGTKNKLLHIMDQEYGSG
jgi:hypothetical protein